MIGGHNAKTLETSRSYHVIGLKPARPEIQYSVEHPSDVPFGFTALEATANGRTYSLISKSKEMCLQVFAQRDFEGNGFIDALDHGLQWQLLPESVLLRLRLERRPL
jgi:hypothetical protein